MKINFVLPNNFNKPIGGYRIVYDYANRLYREGNDVSITFMLYDKTPFQYGKMRRVLKKCKILLFFYAGKIYTSKKEISWYSLDENIHINFSLPYNYFFKNSDVIVATGWETAFTVDHLSKKKGKKYYFIQHDEKVFGPEKLVRKTWNFKSLKKIVIASWLKTLISSTTNQSVSLVKNFVDTNSFYVTNDINERNHVVSMLYHENPAKGSSDGLKVLKEVKKNIPDLTVELFGTANPPKNLPDFIHYTQSANDKQLRHIYNISSVFLFPSHLEGWGLTATEAMACGAALVSTKNYGVNDFGVDGYSAILTDVSDIEGMANAVMHLLENDRCRKFIATNGMAVVSKLTFNNSFNALRRVFQGE
ncbi:glycosyltransferase family 4 protein [Weissella paramesenteroides]